MSSSSLTARRPSQPHHVDAARTPGRRPARRGRRRHGPLGERRPARRRASTAAAAPPYCSCTRISLRRAGSLVDLGDGPAAEHEDRGLPLGPHRLHQRLHHPRRRRQPARSRSSRTLDATTTPDAAGADPRLDHDLAPTRQRRPADRGPAWRRRAARSARTGTSVGELDQVGLVGVPGEHVGAVEQPGPASTARAQARNSVVPPVVVPRRPHRDEVAPRPVDGRVVPDHPPARRCRASARAASSSSPHRARRRARWSEARRGHRARHGSCTGAPPEIRRRLSISPSPRPSSR